MKKTERYLLLVGILGAVLFAGLQVYYLVYTNPPGSYLSVTSSNHTFFASWYIFFFTYSLNPLVLFSFLESRFYIREGLKFRREKHHLFGTEYFYIDDYADRFMMFILNYRLLSYIVVFFPVLLGVIYSILKIVSVCVKTISDICLGLWNWR